jgi:hypothetical protein
MAKNPRWAWWEKALTARDKGTLERLLGTPELPLHGDEYQIGYFRMLDKEKKRWVPVGIYKLGSVDVAMVDNEESDRDLVELFHWCCKHPVTFAAYNAAIKGGGWADEPAISPQDDNTKNMSEFERLNLEYQGEKEMCEEFLKTPITTQEQADKVAIWKNRLTKIKGKAETFHKVEKQPHLDAGRAVDDKWRDLKEEPDKLNKRLLAHIKPFLDKKQREADEKALKAREEAKRIAREKADADRRAQAEQDRIATQAASEAERELASRQAHERAEQEKADLDAQEAAVKEEAKGEKVSAGRTGAKVSSRKRRYGKVNDYKAAAVALVELKNSELIELIDKIANRAATDEMPFDGMTIETETVYV